MNAMHQHTMTDAQILEIGLQHFRKGHDPKAENNFIAAVREILATALHPSTMADERSTADIVDRCDRSSATEVYAEGRHDQWTDDHAGSERLRSEIVTIANWMNSSVTLAGGTPDAPPEPTTQFDNELCQAAGELLRIAEELATLLPAPQSLGSDAAVSEVKSRTPEPCYSFNQEDYTEGDLHEVLQNLEDRGDLVEGVVFYMGETMRQAPSDYFRVDDMLDSMGERAFEEAGEWADDFPDVSKEKRAELKALISGWLDANVCTTFFTAKNTREVKVTDEMLVEHRKVMSAAPSAPAKSGRGA